MNIAVLGGGSFGITLAEHLAPKYEVKVWEFLQERVDVLNAGHCPLLDVDVHVKVSSSFSEVLTGAEMIIIVVPSSFVAGTLYHAKEHIPTRIPIVIASKGIDDSLQLLTEIVAETVNNPLAVISGPTIAKEVVRGVPSRMVAASTDATLAHHIATTFSFGAITCTSCTDPIGVQLGGALKNIVAVWGGIIDGLKMGMNTKAALMTIGIEQMMIIGTHMHAQKDTFMTAAGVGDLIVTCTSPHSRNRTLGEKLGQGISLAEAQSQMTMVAEGIHTTEVAVPLAKKLGISFPLATELYKIMHEGKDAKESLLTVLAL